MTAENSLKSLKKISLPPHHHEGFCLLLHSPQSHTSNYWLTNLRTWTNMKTTRKTRHIRQKGLFLSCQMTNWSYEVMHTKQILISLCDEQLLYILFLYRLSFSRPDFNSFERQENVNLKVNILLTSNIKLRFACLYYTIIHRLKPLQVCTSLQSSK